MTKCRKCGKELAGWEEDNFFNKCSDCNDEYVRWLNSKTKDKMYENLERICYYNDFWHWFNVWDNGLWFIDMMVHGWLTS